ncbi:HD domain-containing protein [Vaginella massiliensis]|uniref:HD domain-containing protein n=1 Tax=Vaginella massiliensis TaxID=1816680 RepID=UPI000839A76A|nr:HD domain-containing protein [Vaginella massiliensis]
MDTQAILQHVKQYVREAFAKDGSGHDYYHVERVVNNAKKILQHENADVFLVELAAWVHDIGDYKLHNGTDRSEELITALLQKLKVDEKIIRQVNEIVSQVSYSKGNIPTSIEAQIVQDADRLDAIGAVGVARCFAYGGSAGKRMYDPDNNEKDASSVQHFYDKLLKLKDLMHTETAKSLAQQRHDFLEVFLKQFYSEVK